jgi:hypothetical protein
MELRNRLLIRVTGISSAAIRLSFETPLSSAAEDDEFFYGPPRPFVIGGTVGDAGLTGSKSTPETLTTACHAASWLARSWRCGWRCASIGPENFP